MQIVQFEGTSVTDCRRDHPRCPAEIDGYRFVTDRPLDADWLVVAQSVRSPVETRVPVERRVFLATEPNGYLPKRISRQFGIIIAPFDVPGFRGTLVRDHGGLPARFATQDDAMTGRLDFAELMSLPVPDKADRITVVTSNKSMLPGHRKRLAFLREAGRVLGPMLEVYGHGIRPIGDKANVIYPNKYHLVVENSVLPGYWTEKLADAFLGHAFPFVVGPPDLTRWFPAESFMSIDVENPSAAIAAIKAAIDADIYSERREAVAEARRRLLTRERRCHVVARTIAAHPSDAAPLAQSQIVQPEPRAPFTHRVRREAVRFIWQMHTRLNPVIAKSR